MKDELKQVTESGQEPLELLHKIDQVIESKFGTQIRETSSGTFPFELHFPKTPELTSDQTKALVEAQMHFFIKGQSYDNLEGLLPLHLSAYREPEHLRSDFPVIIRSTDTRLLLSLRSWIDDHISDSGLTGNEGNYLKIEMLKLEKLLKKETDGPRSIPFKATLAQCMQTIREDATARNGFDATLEKIFAKALSSVNDQDVLVGYSATLYPSITKGILQNQNRDALEKLASELAYRHAAIRALVDSGKTTPSADKRDDKAWDSEIDFDKLDKISASLPHNDISTERLERLKFIASTLGKWLALLDPIKMQKLVDKLQTSSIEKAKQLARECRHDASEFFKAYHMASLEMENKYTPAHHDIFFDNYDASMLTASEQALIFPVALELGDNFSQKVPALLEILNATDSIKIIVREPAPLLNQIDGIIVSGAASMFSKMALNVNHAAICQTAQAFLVEQQDGLIAAFAYNGPALITVFDGISEENNDVPGWLLSGMAPEARVFSNFSYNPDKGTSLADRFILKRTPAMESNWPEQSFTIVDGTQTFEENVFFSAVEFCAVQAHFASHFKKIKPDEYHEKQISVASFVGDARYHQEGYLPFILMADKKTGEINRVLVDKEMVEAAYRVMENWHFLQELAGINNSHVAQKTASLRDEWNAEQEKTLRAVKEEYDAKLNQDRENLTNEIIGNIATGLLSSDIIQMGSMQSVPATSAPSVAVPTEVEEITSVESTAEKVEDDEDVSFDEAYIDTPLCTSCNECCNQNDLLFLYDDNKQAYIDDVSKGTFKQLVTAAENCPVHIIHPGKPQNPDEPDLDDLVKRAEKFN